MRISDWSSDVCSSDLLPLADGISTIDIDGLDDAFDSAVDAHNTAWFDQAIAGTPAFGGQGRGRRHIRDFLGPLLGGSGGGALGQCGRVARTVVEIGRAHV